MSSSQKVGILFTLLAALCMATTGIFSRHSNLSAESITFFRLFLGAIFLGIYFCLSGQFQPFKALPPRGVILSGLFLAGFMLLYVQAMNHTSMANAILLVYLGPIPASLYAHFFLKEYLAFSAWAAICMTLCGFMAILEFQLPWSLPEKNTWGILLGLGSMCCYAGFIIANRTIPKHFEPLHSAFYQFCCGTLLTLPFFWNSAPDISPVQALWLLGTGLIPGFLAISLAVIALRVLPAATFGTLAYFEPLMVIIFGWLFFAESLSALQCAGCALILGGGVLKTLLPKKVPQ